VHSHHFFGTHYVEKWQKYIIHWRGTKCPWYGDRLEPHSSSGSEERTALYNNVEVSWFLCVRNCSTFKCSCMRTLLTTPAIIDGSGVTATPIGIWDYFSWFVPKLITKWSVKWLYDKLAEASLKRQRVEDLLVKCDLVGEMHLALITTMYHQQCECPLRCSFYCSYQEMAKWGNFQ
jgi:hypothetical protein